MIYDATQMTQATPEECRDAVGKAASLTLTGTITGWRESPEGGRFVIFKPDARWGMVPGFVPGMDLECFSVEP